MNSSHTDLAQIFMQPELYPHPVGSVEHLQTHISQIFLTGSHAYKIKKPLNLGFLDFSNLERRMHFCQEELRLNQRLAKDTYLQVLGLVKENGNYYLKNLDEAGDNIIEPALQMRQMDRSRQMDNLLSKNQVTKEQIKQLAHLLGRFYSKAEHGWEVAHFGRPAQVRFNVEENFNQTEEYQGVTVAAGRWRAIRDYSLNFLDNHQATFGKRVREGFIVDGHGDLHSGNINLPVSEMPIVFDCIEFNQRFRFQDAACDLAFLAMDLDYQGCWELSDNLVSEYIASTEDQGINELINFYKCYRAVVRAKVFGFELQDQTMPTEQKFTDLTKAKRYFRLAADYARLGGIAEPPFFMLCVMGLMGTGKTYLARNLSERLGWTHISSDETRKRLAGFEPEERSSDGWEQGLYKHNLTQKTYDALLSKAQEHVAMGESVILDASFRSDQERRRFRQIAEEFGAKPIFIDLKASRQVISKRLLKRQAKGTSTSDGRLELYDKQASSWESLSADIQRLSLALDGGAPLSEKVAIIMRKLEAIGHAH
jgi:aminoglycoside phosphotransferase family enzyme/predicted kinase